MLSLAQIWIPEIKYHLKMSWWWYSGKYRKLVENLDTYSSSLSLLLWTRDGLPL